MSKDNPGPWWKEITGDAKNKFWERVDRSDPMTYAKSILLRDALEGNGEALNSGYSEGYLKEKKQFIKEIKAIGGTEVVRSVDEDWDYHAEQDCVSWNFTLAFDRGFATISVSNNNWTRLRFTVADLELTKKLTEIGKKFFHPRAESRNIYVITMGSSGFELTDIGKAALPLVRENYSPKVLEDYGKIIEDLKSDTPGGRISIIEGVPGTGKTFLVRGLLHEAPKSTCVIVPAGMLAELAGPSLISVLLEAKEEGGKGYPIILIIEDGDMAIIKRDAGNMSTITSLLNFGDGMLGSLIDLRIIITTNAKRIEIDDAIKRPGRLSAIVKVDYLSSDDANKAFARLMENRLRGHQGAVAGVSFSSDNVTLAEVYKKARQFGWKPDQKAAYKDDDKADQEVVELEELANSD